ncbi:hypothetical protein WMW72_32600 [Paenibacillus filicis]|uniref:Uncharacterized protein n=1 Tax=Paenibacillus filicis TaxID=669464 RepID=A0ABU9DV04_9BACL
MMVKTAWLVTVFWISLISLQTFIVEDFSETSSFEEWADRHW